MDASLAFVGTGAAFGVALGSSLLGSRNEGLREEKTLAVLLVAVSAAMLSITLQHGVFASWRGVGLEFVEYVTALCVGPLFAGYVRARSRGELAIHPASLLHFLPAALVGIHILATSSVVVPMTLVMLIQMAYTTAGVRELVVARRRGVAMSMLRWPARFVALAILIHLAQTARTIGFDVAMLRNVVPITAIAGLEVLAILAFRESILASRAPRKPVRERTEHDDASVLLAELDAAMRRHQLFADTSLGLEGLARSVGSTPHRVSNALNAERGGFFEYVTSFRLQAVREALENRENDRYTIDSLAENAGFRSRSTFYAAFRRRFGVTPSEFRKRHESRLAAEPGVSLRASDVPAGPR